MKQISYYNGEESSHPIGFGVAPVNIFTMKSKIRKTLSGKKIDSGLYLDKRAVIKINENGCTKDYSGDLEIQIIAESERDLKKAARRNAMPFDDSGVTNYTVED